MRTHTNEQWKEHVKTLKLLREQGRLYRGQRIPKDIPRNWPDHEEYP